MIQFWSALTVVVFTVVIGPLLRGEYTNRLNRRVESHVAIRKDLAGSPVSTASLDDLIGAELVLLTSRESKRLNRKVDPNSVGSLVSVALIGGGLVYWFVSLAVTRDPSDWVFWLLWVLAVIVGILTLGLSAVGLGDLYKYPAEDTPTDSPETPEKPA